MDVHVVLCFNHKDWKREVLAVCANLERACEKAVKAASRMIERYNLIDWKSTKDVEASSQFDSLCGEGKFEQALDVANSYFFESAQLEIAVVSGVPFHAE